MNATAPLLLATVLAAAPLAAQGGILWADPTQQSTLHVREYANGDLGLCFDGWSTSSINPLLNGEESAAVGTDPGTRSVSSSSADFLRGGSGGAADNPLFPFVPDARVLPIFRSAAPGLDWFGFLAATSGPVPDRDMGALSFRISLVQPLPWSALQPLLLNSRVGVALADSNGNQAGTRFLAVPGRVQAAAICAHEFDRGTGTTTINYAGIEGGALGTAVLSHPNGSPWTAGRTGSALRAGATCNTGWRGDLGGRLTMAWAMRQGAPSAGVSVLASLDAFRIFTGGTAGTGVRCSGWGGAPANLDLGANVQAMAANAWVHVALVIDGDAAQARWFVNGVAGPVIAITGRPALPASASTLLVGATPSVNSAYHLDEFRLHNDAVAPATVASWAGASPAMAMPYSATCGTSLRTDGVPTLGNAAFALRIEAPPGSGVLTTLGVGATLQGLPLPLDLGLLDPTLSGCLWYSDLAGQLPTQQVPANGILVVGLPIPANQALRGLELHVQSFVIDQSGARRASNAVGLSIE